MASLEDVGRARIIEMIDSLESAPCGLDPTFYHTLSFEGDIAEAARLRGMYDMPRPAEVQAKIDAEFAALAAHREKLDDQRRTHDHRMKADWLYRVRAWLLGQKY